ncbi:unnamed protein product [Malus baccata var. baccata]
MSAIRRHYDHHRVFGVFNFKISSSSSNNSMQRGFMETIDQICLQKSSTCNGPRGSSLSSSSSTTTPVVIKAPAAKARIIGRPFPNRGIENGVRSISLAGRVFVLSSVPLRYELTSAVVINGYVEKADPEAAEIKDDREYEDKLVILPPKSMLESDKITLPVEKPPVSGRFGHRKPTRSIPEARICRNGGNLLSRKLSVLNSTKPSENAHQLLRKIKLSS